MSEKKKEPDLRDDIAALAATGTVPRRIVSALQKIAERLERLEKPNGAESRKRGGGDPGNAT